MSVDLDAYRRRIAHAGALEPTLDTLRTLHFSHATHIPFENLDILLGRGIALDLDSLQRKLVTDRRGGYCFEQNSLFGAVLAQLGFVVTPLLARVRYGAAQVLPRTHMVLLVEIADSRWIADVGFGAEGLLEPVPFGSGAPAPQHRWCYRVVPQGDLWIMQSLRGESWSDLYAFTLEPQHPIDFEVANHYTSTHPDSRFVQMLIAQRPLPDRRIVLRNRELTIDRGDTADRRAIASDEELLEVLASEFDLRVPRGTRFGVLAGPPASL